MPGGWRWWEYLEWWCVADHHRLWEGRAPPKVDFPLGYVAWGLFFFCGSVWNGGSRYSKKSLRKDSDSMDFWREYLQWSCCTVPKCRKYIHIDPIFQRNKSMHWTKLGRDIFRMMNCWSSIQPAKVFQNMLFWKSQLAICHVETIFWWSGTLLELFSENNKRVRSWDYLEKWPFFFWWKNRGRNFGKLSSAKKRHFSGEKVRVLTTPKTLFESCMAWRVGSGILPFVR